MFGWLRRALPKGSDPVAPQAVEGKIEVTDADTIWVGDEKFRLVGFDAPETTHAKSEHEYRMGEAAADRLRELIAPPNKLKLERLAGSDIHERGLARLYINGRDVAEIAIEEGWGVPFDGNRRRSDEMPDWDGMGCILSDSPAGAPRQAERAAASAWRHLPSPGVAFRALRTASGSLAITLR